MVLAILEISLAHLILEAHFVSRKNILNYHTIKGLSESLNRHLLSNASLILSIFSIACWLNKYLSCVNKTVVQKVYINESFI